MRNRKRPTRIAPFRAADYLQDDEVMLEYLAAAQEDDNPAVLACALADVAEARKNRARIDFP